ncbi:MAG: mandelate racemase/muconate lactonizing enzyme family protein [Chloroflexota bacterium]|nr:mandelate racemase/muconate lactonizing enzyme family protein [Chloroflexota bacterium]
MKIARVDVALYRIPAEKPRVDAIQSVEAVEMPVVEVTTDSGLTGVGFTYTIGKGGPAVASFIQHDLAPLALGEDPLNTERVWQKLWWGTHWVGRGGVSSLGISAVDIALWDIKARHAGMSLHQLLGGARDRMPVYSTDGGWLQLSEAELVEQSVAFLEQGFVAVKMKLGKPDGAEDVRRARAVRKAIGDDAKLMADVNMGWKPHQAIDMARRLEEFNLGWLEEPCENDDVSGHARLARSTTIPIALGESLYNRYVFKEYIEAGAVSIVQADVGRVGGITEWMKVAHMADSFNLSVSPHFLMELHLPLVASIPNGLYVEYVPYLERVIEETLTLKDGCYEAPKQVGLGFTFDKGKLKRYVVG